MKRCLWLDAPAPAVQSSPTNATTTDFGFLVGGLLGGSAFDTLFVGRRPAPGSVFAGAWLLLIT